MKLVQMFLDYGRMGDVVGLFVVDDFEEFKKKITSSYIYFGEILGKHSEVTYSNMSPEEFDLQFRVIEIDGTALQTIVDVMGTTLSGYNPLDYIEEDEEDDSDE